MIFAISKLSEGAIKCPIFQTSTFVFESAEAGKAFFEVAYGLREQGATERSGLIYSRLNNPDLEILEDRLTLWDEAEAAAVFESGMAAISTTLLTFLKPGDVIVRVDPRYFRPTEVETLLGHPAKAKEKLGWEPTIELEEGLQYIIEYFKEYRS